MIQGWERAGGWSVLVELVFLAWEGIQMVQVNLVVLELGRGGAGGDGASVSAQKWCIGAGVSA